MGQAYPDARTELEHRDAFELLVATVLSAQTTDQRVNSVTPQLFASWPDARVNSVTPQLFASWPDARALAGAAEQDVTALLHPLGMGATRARRIIGLAQGLLADHGGEVPDDQAALEALPGVGRKTAHVVRGTWFGHEPLAVDTHVGRVCRRPGWPGATDPRRVAQDVLDRPRTGGATAERAVLEALPGVGRKTAHVVRGAWFGHEVRAVDTHVGRVSRRLGWTEATDPRRVEQDVLDRLRTDGAPAEATVLGLRLILHGRRVCLARTPRCGTCTLADVCPSAEGDR